MAGCSAFSGAIRDNASPFIDLADDTYSGLIANLGTFTEFVSDPQVQAATASSSFSMNDLTGAGMDRPTTVYFVTADTAEAQTWLRLMIWAATYTFKRKPKGARLRCTFLLDEFANLGYLREMPKDISLVAGSGIDYTLIVQGLDQLKDVYGDAKGTLIGNCRYKWFCNVDDLDSAKYLSEYLGKYTVGTVTTGKSEGQPVGPGRAHEGKSTNFGEMGKDLLSPDQILQLGRNAAILLETGTLPKYIRPVDYWDLPKAFARFKDSCPRLFWDPPLQWDPNPNSSIQQNQGNGSAAPQKKPFDYGYYSPDGIAEREREAQQKPPEQKPSSNYDPTYYSPEKIAEREAAKKTSPPPAPKKPKAKPGNWDWDEKTDSFEPKKPEGGGDT